MTNTERDQLEQQKQQLLKRQQELKRQLDILNDNLDNNRLRKAGKMSIQVEDQQ
jgi:hypothetical protein